MRIRFRKDGLAASLHTKRTNLGQSSNKLALLCPGLPYVPGEEHVTTLLLNLGFDVIQIQYFGTYDSDGSFDPKSAIASVISAIDTCLSGTIFDPKSGSSVALKRQVDLMVGHSFGSYVALSALNNDIHVPVVLVAAPYFCFGALRSTIGAGADLSRHASYMHEAMPFTLRMTSVTEWDRFFISDKDRIAINPRKLSNISSTRIVSVVGADDSSFDKHKLKNYVDSLSNTAKEAQSPIQVEPLIVVPNAGHGLKDTITMSLLESILSVES